MSLETIYNKREQFEATEHYQWYFANNNLQIHSLPPKVQGAKLAVILSGTTLVEEGFDEDVAYDKYVKTTNSYTKTVYLINPSEDNKKVEAYVYIDANKAAWLNIEGVEEGEAYTPHNLNATTVTEFLSMEEQFEGNGIVDIDVVMSQYYVFENLTPEGFYDKETKASFEVEHLEDGRIKLTNTSVIGDVPYSEHEAAVKTYWKIKPIVTNQDIIDGNVDIYPDAIAGFYNQPEITISNDPSKISTFDFANFEHCVVKMMVMYRIPGTYRMEADSTFKFITADWDFVDLYGEIKRDPEEMWNSFQS